MQCKTEGLYHRKDEPLVVVSVFPDQVNSSGRTRSDQSWSFFPERLDIYPSSLCKKLGHGWKGTRHGVMRFKYELKVNSKRSEIIKQFSRSSICLRWIELFLKTALRGRKQKTSARSRREDSFKLDIHYMTVIRDLEMESVASKPPLFRVSPSDRQQTVIRKCNVNNSVFVNRFPDKWQSNSIPNDVTTL